MKGAAARLSLRFVLVRLAWLPAHET